ncbi:hypothetical protein PENSPDRAFT_740276 [Peniophora sp. CONT]|nr:hypothetical protein PENSPDRAFT_740276 [Peniophora sp. CONT]
MPDEKGISSPAYIDMLPPELIRHIFLWANADESHSSPFDPPASVHVSHVSRRWRDITLSCQELWSDWPRYDKAGYWTDICHARSLAVPLNLTIMIDKSELDLAATARRQLALDALSRSRTLVVETRGPQYPPVHGALFQGQPPPRLCTVLIDGFEFRLSDKIWPDTIRVLDMRDACAWRNVDEMIDFFKSIPNLEELTYQYNDTDGDRATVISDLSPSAKHPIRCTPLGRLKRFYLLSNEHSQHWGGFVPGISMFSYLALPPTVVLDMGADLLDIVHWPRSWDDATDAHALTGPIAENLVLGTEALQAHFADAAATGQSYDAITVRDRIIQPGLARQVTDSSALLSVLTFVLPHVDEQVRGGRVSRIACSMYLSVPVFQGATELDVTRTRESRHFLHRFPIFPAVRTLTLAREAVKDFVQAPRFSKYTELFPALEVIRFKDFNCDEYVKPVLPPGPGSYKLPLEFYVALLDTLTECNDAGLCDTWRRIEFVGCANGESVVKRIRDDSRLRRFCGRVVLLCSDSEDYESSNSSDRSCSDRSDSDEGE